MQTFYSGHFSWENVLVRTFFVTIKTSLTTRSIWYFIFCAWSKMVGDRILNDQRNHGCRSGCCGLYSVYFVVLFFCVRVKSTWLSCVFRQVYVSLCLAWGRWLGYRKTLFYLCGNRSIDRSINQSLPPSQRKQLQQLLWATTGPSVFPLCDSFCFHCFCFRPFLFCFLSFFFNII